MQKAMVKYSVTKAKEIKKRYIIYTSEKERRIENNLFKICKYETM